MWTSFDWAVSWVFARYWHCIRCFHYVIWLLVFVIHSNSAFGIRVKPCLSLHGTQTEVFWEMEVSRALICKIIAIQECGTSLSKVQSTGREKLSKYLIRRQNRERRVERLKCRWTENTVFRDINCEGVVWSELVGGSIQSRATAHIVTNLSENRGIHILASRVTNFPNTGRRHVVIIWAHHSGRLSFSRWGDWCRYANRMCNTKSARARTFLRLALPLPGPIRKRNFRTGFATSLSPQLTLTGGKHG